MSESTTIGRDLAKRVVQVHGVHEAGGEVTRKRLRRGQMLPFCASLPRCLVGMAACATAHDWAREPRPLGHEVRLMPPPYAAAIWESLRQAQQE
jgi:transposase